MDVGDGVRVGNHAVDPATGGQTGFVAFTTGGVATDPTAVTLTLQRPDATHLVYGWPSAGADGTLTREGTGRFYRDLVLDQGGKWGWKLAGTGAVATVQESSFRVDRSKVA